MPRPSDSVKNILVTGGAGFIGSHLCERLVALGHRVTVIDDLSTGRRGNLAGVVEQIRFIEADLTDGLGALDGEDVDQVYHLAAAVGVRLVVEQPIRTIETNIEQTSRLLRWACEREATTLIASSSEVYGKGTRLPFREEDDVLYGPTTCPRWSYACTKAIDEYLALAYHAQHQLPVVIVRFFNTVGPRQIGTYGMVLPRFVRAALAGEDILIHGDGSQTRSFCDVRDVADVLPRMLDTRACHGSVFNLGSDRRISINELARIVIDVLGSTSGTRLIPYTEVFGPRFEDLQDRQPDLSLIRARCCFDPRYALEQTIRDLADDMQQTGEAGQA
ncbi:MAG: NAD-dependent epimerase/dehydratase family protein [Phycisphaerales bacterium]|nr:NAD-dependent epimerase/dehydratase family protein [Phycisphaerales bacterium]